MRVAFSRSAHKFVTPLVFEALSGHPVYQDVFDTSSAYQMEHISWARWADALIIAPASADTIARLATGQADDAITTLYLAFRGPVYIAPSMNTAMFDHPATQANLALLASRGVIVIAPGAGSLACGETGAGRMAEPVDIMSAIGVETSASFASANQGNYSSISTQMTRPKDQSFAGTTVLITSGPTREYLDPVRFISSPSSGKMGLALANEAMRRGAKVIFITGPVDSHLFPDGDCEIHPVEAARDMLQMVHQAKAGCDLFLFAAAVGDFRPAQPINKKIKRTGNSISLPLVENPDIAREICSTKQAHQVCIGFAAETNDHDINAQVKLERKQLDAIVLNDVSNSTIGFNSDENEVNITLANGESIAVSQRPKQEVAHEIFEVAMQLLHKKNQ